MKAARWALPVVVVLTLGAASGCVPARGPTPTVLARVPRLAPRELFELLLVRVVRGGFVPTSIDARIGRFEVPARSSDPEPFTLEVQCYADGQVAVRVLDVAVDPQTGIATVPAAVRRELVALGQALDDGDAPIASSEPGAVTGADGLDAPR